MIAKVGSGKSTPGLIRYLFDTKEAKDHTDPHLVASWDGFAPDPGRADDFDAAKKLLVADLDLRVKQARRLGRGPKQHVWHCSIRAAPEDWILSDDEWADIARRIVAATGIAPEGDPDGCRWVAVRHAPDHIHIAATKVRGDLSPARHWHDYLNADRELATVEKEYGLRQLVRGDRTAAQRPTRAEKEKALRTGRRTTSREHLRTTVRTLVAASTSPEEFIRVLTGVEGVLVDVQHFPSGDIRGYKIALSGDTNAQGEPIWFSGSKLAPDLSYPQIRQRLDATEALPTDPTGTRRRTDPWHQATAATERVPHHLDRADDEAAQAHIAAFGEALDALPLVAPADLRPQLRQAATAPLAALADRRPPTDKAARLAQHIRTVVPDHGETVLTDPAWPALATTLSEAETAGHDPRRLLQAATHQRTLDDAVSPAEALTWRIRRLAHRPPPSARALAAQARSTRAARPMVVHQNQPVAATSLSPTKRPSPRR